ncbi:MAG TPA: hypothetical protein VEB21_16300, partial [Terriglobales bacterium]|nr:hypothetical protein [Terriglobales bacterium]
LTPTSLQVISLPGAERLASIPMSGDAISIRLAVAPDDSTAYVTVQESDPESGAIYSRTKVVDLASESVVSTIAGGGEIAVGSVPNGCSAPGCEGDCAGDGAVTVDDLLAAVSISLSSSSLCSCNAFFGIDNGHLAVDALVRAVNNALTGCGTGSTER